MESIREYLKVLELQDELVSLNEFELKDLISKITPESKTRSLVKKINSSLDKRNPIKSMKRISSMLSFLPFVDPKKADSYMSTKSKDYMKFKKMADVVIGNSISGMGDKTRDIASSFLALSAFVVPKEKEKEDPKSILKTNIKIFVRKTRKFMDEQEEKVKKGGFQKEDLPDLAVAWVIISMATAIAVGLGMGGYVIMTAIASVIQGIIITALVLMFLVALFAVLAQMANK